MKLDIIKTGINGEGIAYLDRKPVFIPGTFPGETADVLITDEQERFLRGKARKILKASPARRTSPCPYFASCGGCPLIELKYSEQLVQKRALLTEALWKYGHVKDTFVRDIRPSSKEFGYRSALKLPVQDQDGLAVTGMYKTGTNHFTPIDRCPLHDPKLETLRQTVMAIMHEEQFPAYANGHGLRYLIMRRIEPSVSIALITGKDTLSQTLIEKLSVLPGVVSIVQSVNTARNAVNLFGSRSVVLYGEETIPVEFCGFKIRLSAESFFQLNLDQAAEIYKTAVSKIDPCDVLAECYCGVGVMSIMAKDKARKVFGIESVPQAIVNAKENARENRVPNTEFFCADAAEGLKQLLAERKVDCLLVDPPRSGMDDAMIDVIRHSSIAKIVYVSCSPSTLGKNIRDLKQEYEVRTVIPFDMFPNTPHVESVTVLTRRGTSDRKQPQRHIKKKKTAGRNAR